MKANPTANIRIDKKAIIDQTTNEVVDDIPLKSRIFVIEEVIKNNSQLSS